MVSEGMWSPNRGFQGAAGGTGVWEEDGVRSESCQLSPRSLGSPRARHPRGDAPGRENPRALREPLAAPATASRRRHLGCAGEEEAPAEMDLNLEESLGRAFRDKLRLPMVLVGDSATLLPSARVLLKRREVAEVERGLQRQREEFGQRMELLEQRRQRLCQRKDQLQDVILKFNAFLQASAVRRERALQRAVRARAAGQENEAARLLRELEALRQHRERLLQQTQSLRRFGDYLQDVVARTGQFQDVPAMLAHFVALAGARAALAQEAAAGQERLAQRRAQLQQYQEETDSELLRTRDELARLRARLEATLIEVLQEESRWAQIQRAATRRTLQLGQIKLAVLNLFQLVTAQFRVPMDVALENTEAQLDMVLLCMQDLAAICAELHPREPGLRPPRVPAATGKHRLRHGGARGALSLK
ncbi:cilia- and flagella-associated protein 73 [Columba livia]|uniref:cilia- and flagella-associated protein 73 n=1 Tax=Columba livia TaxID=8932 RepID=UPI0031BBA699